jgi:hypothetical protein
MSFTAANRRLQANISEVNNNTNNNNKNKNNLQVL